MGIGDTATVTIEEADANGSGVATAGGIRLVIPGAAPGDTVTVETTYMSQHEPVGWAKVTRVDSRGENWVKPVCHHAHQRGGQCGGCPLMHLVDSQQTRLKEQTLRTFLERVGWKEEVAVQSSPLDLGYRNRANYVVARVVSGRVRLGSFAPRSHTVARMDGCPVVRPEISAVAARLETHLSSSKVPIYPAEGGLRYTTIRADRAGNVLVDFILSKDSPPWLSDLIGAARRIPAVVGASACVNDTEGNAIRTRASDVFSGRTTLDETVGGVSVEVSASAFAQLNTGVAAAMYETAADWLEPRDVHWDLYCGVGGLGLTVAARHPSTHVIGIETQIHAIELCRVNAEKLGVEATFHSADLRQKWPRLLPPAATVTLNPPRRGADVNVLRRIVSGGADLVYMSCSPASWSRDALWLQENGYGLERVAAWDMLPHTSQMEVLSLFRPV
jgi:23S rRNA (uracil1939-C5)-methyltransferase